MSKFKGKLLPHQEEAKKKYEQSGAILLYHGLGSGKTITSIGSASGDKVVAVVPASLRGNFGKEVARFDDLKKFDITSYNKFIKAWPKGDTLILDEPQRIGRHGTQTSQSILDAAKHYNKRILLTGTPATNRPSELAPIIRTLNPEAIDIPLDQKEFENRFYNEKYDSVSFLNRLRGIRPGVTISPKNKEIIRKAIKGMVHYYEPSKENYPDRIDEIKEVVASPEQVDYYKYVTRKANPVVALKVKMNLPLSKSESKQLNAFMTAARQVSNTTKPFGGKEEVSPKIKQIVEDFNKEYEKNKSHRGLIYSNYIKSGIDEIANEMDKNNIPYVKFIGGMSDKEKQKAVDAYNNGEVPAILVSGAGAEGLDLKKTRSIQIAEPHWNANRIEQVIGRGIRYKSHEGLPKNEKKIKVTKYQTVLSKNLIQKLFDKPADTSSDQYLENLSKDKQKILDEFLDILKEEGVQKTAGTLFQFVKIR